MLQPVRCAYRRGRVLGLLPARNSEASIISTLDQVRPGESAEIVDVSGDDAVAMRLMEMGLTEGEVIENLGAAPLGDPIEYLVRGYRVSLRLTEARRVKVTRQVES